MPDRPEQPRTFTTRKSKSFRAWLQQLLNWPESTARAATRRRSTELD